MFSDLCAFNIRGLNNKQSFLKDFISFNKFGLLAVLETHVKVDLSSSISKFVAPHFSWIFNYDKHYNGRIWVGWDSLRWSLVLVDSSAQHITCKARCLVTNTEFVVSFVYAFNTVIGRRVLWNDLVEVKNSFPDNTAWCILGDFNACLNPSETNHSLYWTNSMLEFKDFTLQNGITDLSFSGHRFTWWDGNILSPICKKLDRCLVNDIWLQNLNYSHAQFGEKGLSDHCPVFVSLGISRIKIQKPFQLFQHLIQAPNFLEVVSSAWNDDIHGDPWFVLTSKLKKVKLAMKMLNVNSGNLQNLVETTRSVLLSFQAAMPDVPSASQFEAEKILIANLQKALSEEEIFLKQKSRVHWLKTGDNNNRFFFNSCKGRWNNNKITSLLDDDGQLHTSHQEISRVAVNFFSDLLGTESEVKEFPEDINLPKISEIHRNALCAPFTANDVLKSFKSMGKNKSPGPDGYPVEFYLTAWSVIGEDVVRGILHFFNTLHLPRIVNSTAIALIPKSRPAASIANYRPISCCNTLYKCISKMIAFRMKMVMPSIISDCQSAFVPGRLIGDNTLLAQSLCRNYHLNTGQPKCTIKLDLRKAFDTLNWSFLEQALEKMNFPSPFINWILACIRTCMFSVKVNGALEGYFAAKSGLRQGDPLSPYLFVIAMEVLTVCLKKFALSTDFKYHWKTKDPSITHIIFADDILLFSRGDVDSVNVLLNGVKVFSEISGLKVNPEKSAVFFGNVNQENRESILTATGFAQGNFPVTYLGLPLITSKLNARDCMPLVQKICGKLEDWTHIFLSYAGRLLLLKVVLFSIQGYWAAHLFLPKSILKKIQSLCIKFLWGGTQASKCAVKVAWKDCCLPKVEGGLGIRDIFEWNKASILYQLWRIIRPHHSSIWLTWIRKNIIKDKHFWTMKATSNSFSWCVKKIFNARSFARDFIRYDIAEGSLVSFWHDPWLDHMPLIDRYSTDIYSISDTNSNSMVGDFIRDNAWHLPPSNHTWIIELRDRINAVTISGLNNIYWNDVKSNFVNLSSIWNSIRITGTPQPWLNAVWHTLQIPKCSFILWLALKNRLYTRNRMISFGLNVDPLCVLCSTGFETGPHLFEECPFSKVVMESNVLTGDWANYVNGVFFNGSPSKAKKSLGFLFLAVAVHSIWRERNERIQKHGHKLNATCIRLQVKATVRNRVASSTWFQKKIGKDPSLILDLY